MDMPYIYESDHQGSGFFSWYDAHEPEVEAELRRCGAVLFRGFALSDHATFTRVLERMCRKVIAGYGDLPPEQGTDRVYGSTPYRQDRTILFHNESSHMPSWPTRQFFACVIAAEKGGETPIADCRRIYQRLDATVRERFAAQGLIYVRHFIDGLDVPWQAFFKTHDRAEVARICAQRGTQHQWKSNSVLMIRQKSQAVARHPVTAEWSFFNQIMLYHPYFLQKNEREMLQELFGPEILPRSVLYGDGTPIEDDVIAQVHGLYEEESKSFPWQPGDLLALENMTVAHARRPFSGARKIIVGMGDPIEMFH